MEDVREVLQYLSVADAELSAREAEIRRLQPLVLTLESKLALSAIQLASAQQEADTLRLHTANVVKLEKENAALRQQLSDMSRAHQADVTRLRTELAALQQTVTVAHGELVIERSAVERERHTRAADTARAETELRELRAERERTAEVVSTLNQHHATYVCVPRTTHTISVTAMLKTEIARLEKNIEEKRREIAALKRDHGLQLQQAEDRFQKTCLSFEERLLRSSGQNGREGQVIESLKAKLASQRREYEQELASARATINTLRGHASQQDRKRGRDINS